MVRRTPAGWIRLIVPGLLLAGPALVGAGAWSLFGWEVAAVFWGACLAAAGLSEVIG